MSDAEIRALERSHNEAPDLATGVAYLRALERVGRATKKQSQTLALLETPPNQADLEFAFDLGWQPAVVVRHLCEGVEEAPIGSRLAWLEDDTRYWAMHRLSIEQGARFNRYLGGPVWSSIDRAILDSQSELEPHLKTSMEMQARRDIFEHVTYRLMVRQSQAEIDEQRDLYCECLFDLI